MNTRFALAKANNGKSQIQTPAECDNTVACVIIFEFICMRGRFV